MGAVSFSIDENLIKELRKFLPLEMFIETGTFLGDSLESAGRYFECCYSVELSEEYYLAASSRFAADQHIHIFGEDSAKFLERNRSLYENKSVLFWLDAHWCAADAPPGSVSQCPLLGELTAIAGLNSRSVIVIDDARLFLAPPGPPHEISQWPCFEEVNVALHRLSHDHVLTVFNDTMIFQPGNIQRDLRDFFARSGVDWLSVVNKSRSCDDLIVQLQSKDLEIRALSNECEQRLQDLNSKEIEIRSLTDQCEQRLQDLKSKELEIRSLADECEQRLRDLNSKDREIKRLLAVSDERLELIERLSGISNN